MRATLQTASNTTQSAKPEIDKHVSKSRSASAHSESSAAAESKGRDCESFFSANSVSRGSSADITQTPNAMVRCVLIFTYHFLLLYIDGATENCNGSSFNELVAFVNYS